MELLTFIDKVTQVKESGGYAIGVRPLIRLTIKLFQGVTDCNMQLTMELNLVKNW